MNTPPAKRRCPLCDMRVVFVSSRKKIRRHCRYDGQWCAAGGMTMEEAIGALFGRVDTKS